MATKKMGAPEKHISQSQFEAMCQIQATVDEICLVLGVSDKTLNKWCRRMYGATFSAVFKEKRALGKISLRRTQFRLAEKSAAMAIFLGKNLLGQTDMQAVNQTVQMNANIKHTSPYEELTVDELRRLASKEHENDQ